MRMPLLVAAALLAAGCVAPEAPVESAQVDLAAIPDALAAIPALDKNASVDVPLWRVGDAWEIEATEGEDTERLKVVVVSADASSYQTRATADELATYDAMFDVSYIGRVRASDLAGHQQDQPVQFFSFPLTDAKTWTARWDEQDITLQATFSPALQTPLGPQPGFVIDGRTGEGEPYVSYDFVPALRWWSRITFEAGYGFKVLGVSENWTGEYREATAKTLLTLGPATPVGTTPAGTFVVSPDQSVIALQLDSRTSQHARAMAILDPDHQEHAGPSFDAGASPAGEWQVVMLPPKPGQWQILAPNLYAPGGASRLTVQEIAISTLTLDAI